MKPDCTVVIGIHGLYGTRSLDRLDFLVHSLEKQRTPVAVIIVDGTTNSVQRRLLRDRLSKCSVRIIEKVQQVFNLCELFNTGIEAAETEWVCTTGADFLFRADQFETYASLRSKKKMLQVQPLYLPNIVMSRPLIDSWKFPSGETLYAMSRDARDPVLPLIHKNGLLDKVGTGAIQYTTRDWFLKHPYDERFKLLGGMDNMMSKMAEESGLSVEWVDPGGVAHQWHKVSKYKFHPQFKKNIEMINTSTKP